MLWVPTSEFPKRFMKPAFKISLCLVVGALCSLPAVLSAQDMNSQPATSTSAPATSDSNSNAPAQTPDQSPAPAKKPHKGGAGGQVKKMIAEYKEKLNLTDDEVTKITAILQDGGKQMATINGDTTLSDDDKKAKMEALHKSTHDQIRAVLTPDQQTTFDTLKPMGGGHKKADNN